VLSDSEGYWCSVGDHENGEVIELEVELEKISRI